jgi:type VI secretion system protein VasD
MLSNAPVARIVFLLILCLGLSSCASTRKMLNFDTATLLSINASADVNPNSNGRASPVVVRVFALKDQRQFKQQDFLALYENAEERLGDDLADVIKLKEFAPNEARKELITLTDDIRYIGIMVEYIRYEDATTTMVLPIIANKTNKFRLDLHRLGIELDD